jgi:hypothetical protein
MAKATRRVRFGVRGLLAGIAVAAVVAAPLLNWLPSMARRRQAEVLLEGQYRSLLDPGAIPIQSFGRLAEKRPADLATLRSSAGDVARRLLRMVEVPDDPSAGLPLEWRPPAHLPGVWAADRLGEWVVAADDFELGVAVTERLFDLTARGNLLPEVETAAVGVLLLQLTPRLGLDEGRRAEAMARVRALASDPRAPGEHLAIWARLAAEVGGRDDLLALLELAGRDREVARVVATSSAFAECRWPGLIGPLSRLAAKADDPRRLLDCAAFVATREGREGLLAYAAGESHPLPERRGAIHRLKRDPAGVAFLLAACDDSARRGTVARFFGRDHARLSGDPPPYDPRPTQPYARDAADPSDPRPELRRLRDDLGRMDDPWPKLLRDLDPESWRAEVLDAGLSWAEADRLALDRSAHVMNLLSRVAPGRAWGVSGPPMMWKDWFAALESLPDGNDRLGADFALTSLPPDCIEVLAQIARTPASPHREAALRLLVSKTERTEEVGPLIKALSERAGRDPGRLSARGAESLRVLRRRFAVDFASDLPAWRAWWDRERVRAR